MIGVHKAYLHVEATNWKAECEAKRIAPEDAHEEIDRLMSTCKALKILLISLLVLWVVI